MATATDTQFGDFQKNDDLSFMSMIKLTVNGRSVEMNEDATGTGKVISTHAVTNSFENDKEFLQRKN
ncbi:MAG: hypothetical protein ACJA2P_001808 [Rhodoferax sp.]|jgi:hypothetical protein